MSQRNPLNERYNSDAHTGSSRKSAASAKPKAKAASSVTISSGKKSPKERKAEERAERKRDRERQRELDRKYYNPGTARYKRLRRIWWLCLFAAIACTALSWFTNQVEPRFISIVALVAAYGFIVGAFALDFTKIRKERKEFQKQMIALEAQEAKKEKAALRKQNKKNNGKGGKAKAATDDVQQAPAEPEKKSFFSKIFGKKDEGKGEDKVEAAATEESAKN